MPFGSPCVQWPENTFDQTVDKTPLSFGQTFDQTFTQTFTQGQSPGGERLNHCMVAHMSVTATAYLVH